MSAIELRAVAKRYEQTDVLLGVDLDVPAASMTAILGPSGSGKTTLLRLIAGFERADAGTIALAGRVLDDGARFVRPQDRGIGYVPQDGALFPHLTVLGNVGFGLARRERPRAVELLELVGLGGLQRRYPHQLSGGQQQRVALARALAISPAVVLLDEPFSSLDAALRVELRQDVAHILRESSTTALLVTHDQDEALSLADHVAVLRDGEIAQYATPQELYTKPLDDQLAQFIGDANVLHGIFDGELVQTALGELAAHWHGDPPPSGPVTILIRPEQIELRQANDEAALTGQILRSGYHGHDTLVHVEIEHEHGELPLVVRIHGEANLSPGTHISLRAQGPVLTWPAPPSDAPPLPPRAGRATASSRLPGSASPASARRR